MSDTRSNTSCPPDIYGYSVDGEEPSPICSAPALAGTCPETTGSTTHGSDICIRQVELTGGLNNDESENLLDLFNEFLEDGEPVKCFICAQQGVIYLNRVVTLYASNVDITFLSPIVYGAAGALRMFGDQPEVTRNDKLKAKLREAASEGTMTLKLSTNAENMQASEFVVGDVIILRGENDMFGRALTKQTVHVTAIDAFNNNLTIAEELEQDFDPTYPASDWPADLTTGTTVALSAFAAFVGNAAKGDVAAGCNIAQLAASGITDGSIVLVSTSETESDINVHAHDSGGNPYRNAARLEIKRLTSVNTGTGAVYFDSPLIDDYSTTYYAGITLYEPITNSFFRGVRASYNASQTSRNTHGVQAGYAYRCQLVDCQVDGSGGGKGNGVRISNSLECEAVNCRVSNPAFLDSGEGYGLTLYYSDRCAVIDSYGEGCRHTFLLQKANNSRISGCHSLNDRISGIDIHGVRSINTHVYGCHVIGGLREAADADHKSALRVGNTSHACGDFNTSFEACFISGYSYVGANQTNSALEVFGASEGISMRGCFICDCETGIRGGYDNLAGAGEDDDVLTVFARNNTWLRVTNLLDLKSTSVVELDEGGITKVQGTLANDQTFSSVITTSSAPDITTGDQLIATTYTAKSPNRRITVRCVLPYISTGTAVDAAMTMWVGSTCIGTAIVRVSTTGANSGTQMECIGDFIGDGTAQSIQVRFGPNSAATLTVNSRFAHHSTQQPRLYITEPD